MQLIKNTLLGTGTLLLTILATSCGGHTMCDAYGYMDYKNEVKEVKSTPILQDEYIIKENGTI